MDIHDAICQRLVARMMRMRQALSRFDDASAEQTRVGPTWNVRDLAAHMLYWTTEAATQMPLIARGQPAPSYNFDRINADVQRRNRRRSFVMLLPQLRAAEEKLLAAIRAAPADQLLDSPLRTWIDETGADHYDHHWPGLQKAAESLQ